jgi:hypothetical protein
MMITGWPSTMTDELIIGLFETVRSMKKAAKGRVRLVRDFGSNKRGSGCVFRVVLLARVRVKNFLRLVRQTIE